MDSVSPPQQIHVQRVKQEQCNRAGDTSLDCPCQHRDPIAVGIDGSIVQVVDHRPGNDHCQQKPGDSTRHTSSLVVMVVSRQSPQPNQKAKNIGIDNNELVC